ncbi:hypothetical protein ABIE60_003263 [Marinobacterium sp. MBR-109]
MGWESGFSPRRQKKCGSVNFWFRELGDSDQPIKHGLCCWAASRRNWVFCMTKVKRKHLTPELGKLREYEAVLVAMRSNIELSEEGVICLGKLITEIRQKAEREREEYLAKQAVLKAERDRAREAKSSSEKSRARAHPGTVKIVRSVRSGLAGKTSSRDWKKVK